MLTFFLCLIIVFLILHLVLMENYRRWFLMAKTFDPSSNISSSVTFTIIIPARNEEDQIGKCLQSVLDQHYPSKQFQVIVADDYSTDRTATVVEEWQKQYPNVSLLQLEKVLQTQKLNSYKKKAIELAIKQATGDWIVTTDADCVVCPKWLSNFAAFIDRNNSVFVAAPVKFSNTGSFVSIFQCLDFISLQGITAASVSAGFHTMCNGANVAYSKKAFQEVDGFKGIDKIASGDDMLLMHKIYLRYKDRVHFLFNNKSIVTTPPMPSWKAFFNQRIRWASKADKFDDKRILAVLVFIYLFNLLFVLLLVMGAWYPELWLYWIGMIVAKTIIELRFMVPVAQFFNEEKLLWWFPVMQPVHIAYTIIAGWLGKFGKYSWKGRLVK